MFKRPLDDNQLMKNIIAACIIGALLGFATGFYIIHQDKESVLSCQGLVKLAEKAPTGTAESVAMVKSICSTPAPAL
ncbi:TPA: hypothetical protein LU109_003589 [Enterobacter hormaechei subsp. xiangfangensis]|nr:hypothetical protein [Enterobacter hormaechei subsp. xiangfangensis]